MEEELAAAFQSRYRAASHFRPPPNRDTAHQSEFQSRYRAASHFRIPHGEPSLPDARYSFNLVIERLLISGQEARAVSADVYKVSISLSSGFSFQGPCGSALSGGVLTIVSISLSSGFSFQETAYPPRWQPTLMFQSRYRAASHFRHNVLPVSGSTFDKGFNLVIERLLISGMRCMRRQRQKFQCFNLVIERLLISGKSEKLRHAWSIGFNLVIERLLISGLSPVECHACQSQLFQSRYRAASHFRKNADNLQKDGIKSFNLVIERLLISGGPSRLRLALRLSGFNLVIERLLISGENKKRAHQTQQVSISLSSGFSFQVGQIWTVEVHHARFQSRYRAASHFRPMRHFRKLPIVIVFQSRYRAASHFRGKLGAIAGKGAAVFQSRYRAASHFRCRLDRQLINR